MDLALLTLFPIFVTKLVDLIRNAFDSGDKAPPWVWNVVAFTVGVTVCVIWHVNALAQFSSTRLQGTAGEILTGLGVAGGAAFWHEVMDLFSSKAKGVTSTHVGVQE